MTKEIKSFWDTALTNYSRKIETQKDFYDMMLSADKGLKNFVYKPDTIEPIEKRESRIVGIKFSNCSFAFTTIKNLDFHNCKFINCKFNHSKFENCNFHDCTFEYVNMYGCGITNTYIDPNSFDAIIPNYTDFIGSINNANMCVKFFQILLNNAIVTGQKEFEKNADYHFKKWKGLNYLQKKFTKQPFSDKMNWWLFIKKFFPNFFQYLITGYGYRVDNFIITFFLGFISFLYVNHTKWIEFAISKRDVSLQSFDSKSANIQSSIFYTLDATTKLIDSQMQPTSNTGMIWLSIEGLFGFVLLSGLITIILNKFVK